MNDFKNPWEITDEMLKNPWEVGGGRNVLDKEEEEETITEYVGNNLYLFGFPEQGHSMKIIAETAQKILDNNKINVNVKYFTAQGLTKQQIKGIVTRQYLAPTDGLVYIGHGANITKVVKPYLKPKVAPEAPFFGDGERISGGETVEDEATGWESSAYEIQVMHNSTNLPTKIQDVFLARGAVHEYFHQLLNNAEKRTKSGLKPGDNHSDSPLAKRYKSTTPIATRNMMMNGSSWSYYSNPKITDSLFLFLPIDITLAKQAIGKNKGQTKFMKSVKSNSAK